MSWKTAASRHLPAYLMVAPLLISLSGVCSNGLLPDAMLQKAMLACHHEIPFACGEGVSLEAAMTYFLLKMRQLAAKLRSLLASTSEWNALSRKLTQPQRESFLAMLRALQPGFCMECSDETPKKKKTCPVEPAPQLDPNVEKPAKPADRIFKTMENQICLQLANTGPSFTVALNSY